MPANSQPPMRAITLHGAWVLPAAVTLVLALVLAVGWGLLTQRELGNVRDERAEQAAEIDLLRQRANATAYTLMPSVDAPPNAGGTAFFSLSGTGVISVTNLSPPPEGRSYQAWYYPASDAQPLPGATFTVDDTGTGFMLIPADVGLFTDVAITLEPVAGTTVPSGPVILSGSTGGARG